MEWTEEETEVGMRLNLAIFRNQLSLVEEICQEHPWIVQRDQNWQKTKPSWLGRPAGAGDIDTVAKMLQLGFNVDALSGKEESTALVRAVGNSHFELAKLLLSHNANPNLSRPIISALNARKPAKEQLKFVKLLVENGCEVNTIYALYGDMSRGFTALDWAKHEDVVDYLKSKGAKHATDLR